MNAPTPVAAGSKTAPAVDAGNSRNFALDVIRVSLTLMVTFFHALSELTWMLTIDEVDALLRHPAGRLIPLGYTAVDGFLVLTGLLSMEKLVRKWSDVDNRPTFRDVLNGYYSRMIQMGLPLATVLIWYGVFFRTGKYPDVAVRSEGGLLAMRMLRNDTLAHLDGSITTDGALTTMRPNAIALWPWVGLYVNNMFPFGGLLSHTWSLAVQMQWYLWLPLLPYAIYATRLVLYRLGVHRVGVWEASTPTFTAPQLVFTPRMAIVVCVSGMLLSLAFRRLAHESVSQFNPSSIVGLGAHFFWYASTLTRCGPLFAGGIIGVLSTPTYKHLVEGLVHRGKSTTRRGVVVNALCVNVVVVFTINALWKDLTHTDDETSPALRHQLMYILFRPGGTLSSVGYAWVVFSAMHGISWLSLPNANLQTSTTGFERFTGIAPASDAAAAVMPNSETGSAKRDRPATSLTESVMLQSPTAGTFTADTPMAAPAPTKTPRPSLFRRTVVYLVPITYLVYLVNSTLYEQLYGWPQRLHPCPQLLHPSAMRLSEQWIRSAPFVFAPDSALAALNPTIHSIEVRLADTITGVVAVLRGPADLYCSTDAATGVVNCRGLCFSNEIPNVATQSDPSCILDHNCTVVPSGLPRTALVTPPTAWLQFFHYSLICVVATWVFAWLLFVLVDVPIGMLLMSKPVKMVLYLPVLAHAAVVLAISIPAHVYMNFVMVQKVTPEIEHALMHAHFK